MQIKRYTLADKTRWDAFIAAAKNAHFMHKRDYMEYHADRFTDHSLIVTNDKDEWLFVLPANEKDGTLYSHQGLSFGGFIQSGDARMSDMLEAFAVLRVYAQAAKLKKLLYKAIPSFYHLAPAQEDLYALFRNDAKPYRTDVSTTIDCANRLPFSTLRKRGAKKAEKAGVAIRKSDDFVAFHAIVTDIVKGKYDTAPTHSLDEMKLLAGRFPDSIKLYAAYLGDDLLAGVLIFETDTVAHAQYIGAGEQGRELGALDLLFTTLIAEIYKDKRFFDFGISTEEGGRKLNESLIAQKEGFGGRATVHQFYELDF